MTLLYCKRLVFDRLPSESKPENDFEASRQSTELCSESTSSRLSHNDNQIRGRSRERPERSGRSRSQRR